VTSTAVAAAREHEDLLQLLYLCPLAIARLDEHGTIVLMNPHGTQLLMPLSRDGDPSNLFGLLDPYAPEVGEMARRFAGATGKVCEEHRIVVPQDARRPAQAILSLTLQKVDSDIFVAVLADVTTSATRELNIRMSEERLHAVLDGVKEYAVCTLDLQGSITSWNRAAERLDGFRNDEVMGRNIDMLAPLTAHGVGPFAKRVEHARRDGWHEFEAWRVRKDGSRYWAHCAISTLQKREDETILGFSVITRDTTDTRRSEDNLRLLASTDPLTGALNRRAFFEAAKREEARCLRSHEPLTILLLDVDHFKAVNDTYGHEAGDTVLQRIVTECRAELRSHDLIARYGGEEFAIMLTSGSSPENGSAVAERLRARIERMSVAGADCEIKVTVSVGAAEEIGAGVIIEPMLRAADTAMYAGKREGRNRVVVAPNASTIISSASPA